MQGARGRAALAACVCALGIATSSATANADVDGGVLAGGPGDAPGALAGVEYRSPGASGVTDATGAFRYRDQGVVRFSVGAVEVGTAAGAPLVTPFALAHDTGCTTTEGVSRVVRFLEAIDANADPADGVRVDAATRARASRQRPVRVQAHDDDALGRLVAALTGRTTLPDRDAALGRFWDQVDGQRYAPGSSRLFAAADGLIRSQGVATDGASWFFSYQYGLTRTTLDHTVIASSPSAIPPQIAAQGGNHIGDIDYADGKVYAPIEDGAKRPDGTRYLHPFIALYDASTLLFTGEYHELPQALHVQGVPWVAVDRRRGRLYTAEWSPTTVLNIFDLHTFQLVRTVPLSRTLDRIQGAKMWGGMLYAYADVGDTKPLTAINPDTGHVITVYGVPLAPGSEGEGLAFLPRPDGTLLHTLDVLPDRTGVNFRDHALVQSSLRAQVCAETPLWRAGA
jgi:hypothetical protein